jgi:hypothetical protein
MGNRIRPASVLDILPLSRPPRAQVRLDLAQELLFPHHAGRSLLPWTRSPVYTLLAWGPGGLHACVQARYGTGNFAWEVGYLAAWQADSPAVEDLWTELLIGLGIEAGRQGVTRLLAALPGEDHVDLFRRVGFAPFAAESILAWDGHPPTTGTPAANLKPMQPGDLWAVQRLHVSLTPPLVQQAEGSYGRIGAGSDEAWVQPEGTGVCAHMVRQRSPQGTRLGLLLDPTCRQHAAAFLSYGLAEATPPVYLVLRSYQGELLEVARRVGFRHHAEQLLLVKHLAVAEKQRSPMPARPAERPLGTAPTTPSVGNACAETHK